MTAGHADGVSFVFVSYQPLYLYPKVFNILHAHRQILKFVVVCSEKIGNHLR